MEKINQVILSLGSNIEDRLYYLKTAVYKIDKEIGRVTKKSSVYESEAFGFKADTNFYNICIEVETTLSPFDFLKKTQEIEIEIGRAKKTTDFYESRKIDIDIIFFGDEVINSISLQIPHKFFQKRKFVLLPLNEIYSTSDNLENSLIFKEMLKTCGDNSAIQKTNFTI